MYVPLYVAPRVVLQWRRIKTAPVTIAAKTLRDIGNSGMMLGTYILAVKALICFYRSGLGYVCSWHHLLSLHPASIVPALGTPARGTICSACTPTYL